MSANVLTDAEVSDIGTSARGYPYVVEVIHAAANAGYAKAEARIAQVEENRHYWKDIASGYADDLEGRDKRIAALEAEVKDARRAGGYEALTRCFREVAETGTIGGAPKNPDIAAFRVTADIIEAFRDREYAPPAAPTPECNLSGGRAVRVKRRNVKRRNEAVCFEYRDGPNAQWVESWGNTIAYLGGLASEPSDFDALKAFAATVEGK